MILFRKTLTNIFPNIKVYWSQRLEIDGGTDSPTVVDISSDKLQFIKMKCGKKKQLTVKLHREALVRSAIAHSILLMR